LDAIDKRILALLQTDASLTITEIAERVGTSQTPCWRRIQKLERDGLIRRRVALLDREKLNCSTTAFMMIRTNDHSIEWLASFYKAVAELPEVVDFHRLSGDIDYLLRVVVPDMKAYDAFYKRLISRIRLYDVSSMFSMEEIKSSSELPLDYLVLS
jgi:Lrp/AsnC family transcriptional regulator